MAVNLTGMFLCTKHAVPHFLERGSGSIINVSSMAGLVPTAYMATYGATKAFVNSFSEIDPTTESLTGTTDVALEPEEPTIEASSPDLAIVSSAFGAESNITAINSAFNRLSSI